MKICVDCNISKPYEAFTKKASCADGYETRCKSCRSIRYNKSSLELVVKRLYGTQKLNSTKRNHPLPDYTQEELLQWVKQQPHWEQLYEEWKQSNYSKDKALSIDRIDSLKPYTLDNIALTTWEQNRQNGRNAVFNGDDTRNLRPVRALNLDNTHYKDYPSVALAVREVKGSYWGIASVADGVPVKDGRGNLYQPKTYKGFIWQWI